MNLFDEKDIEEKFRTIYSDEQEVLIPWHKKLFIQILITLPLILVLVGIYSSNKDNSILSIISFLGLCLCLIFLGSLTYWLMFIRRSDIGQS